ncbi:glycoside hydrolase family 38 N-terminal domain-containing protein [Rugosimonospora acidiphila]|uniref:glycoside hydrolase family 38 N-terminal domain-containing protein n=1 Tax=Rugosimonospora acidiphila TaxID=556531 RepID=UPI0031F06FD1
MNESDAVFVPHTHWDREWYEPFQVFRHRLVTELDRLLEAAEADPEFRFTLDGQTAAIEDYLEIRPENRERVRRLVEQGRLALGPWLILLDEFLCGGETIVRNLRLGVEGARALGAAMPVGYLPDMFGHIAQMPQILRRAGIDQAALWRGVPASVEGHRFEWQSPDGSTVLTEYLFDGYDNGLDVLLVPDAIGRALDDYAAISAKRWGDDPVLAMAGTDHTVPDRRLLDWLRAAARPDRRIAVATLAEYLDGVPTRGPLSLVRGELRSHARGNILPGVLSVRRDLKQAMARAEHTIDEAERVLAAWGTGPEDAYLRRAWHKIIESTAHDSVVGSGTDETSDQVAARLAEATQIARAVRGGVLASLAARVPTSGHLAVNTLPFPREMLAEIDLEATAPAASLRARTAGGRELPLQLLSATGTVLGDERFDAAELERVLRRIHRRELFGRQIVSVELEPGQLTFRLAEDAGPEPFDLLELRVAVAAATAAHPGPWRVLTTTAPVHRALVAVPVQASGATSFMVAAAPEVDPPAAASGADGRVVRPDWPGASGAVPRPRPVVDNGRVRVEVATDGTFTLHAADGTQQSGIGRLVDGGDRGDSYNYGPPAEDELVDEPTAVAVEVVETGPVRWAIRVTRDYPIPQGLSDAPDRRGAARETLRIETIGELRRGEDMLRLTVSFVNEMRDHRLRMHIPLPYRVDESASEGQFAVTRRPLTAEGGWGEHPIPTYPAHGFVCAGPVTVLLDHATEYEVVDGEELALTVLRAVGSISRNVHPFRDEPAASEIPAPGAQSLGETITARFGVVLSPQGWQRAQAVRRSAHFRGEALVLRGTGGDARLPALPGGVRVDGAGVAVSTIRRTDNGIEVRLVAMSDGPVAATVTGPFTEVETIDLLGGPLGTQPATEGRHELRLAPWEIRSIVLRGWNPADF